MSDLHRALACSLLAAFVLPAAVAADPCATSVKSVALGGESGLGGTGLQGGEDGLGGTGVRGPGDGVGGTGYGGDEDSGVGGTGIYGAVTAFGSICVNGLHVYYADDVVVDVNGSVATAAALEVGQVVWVEARPREGRLTTAHIAVHSAVIGPIGEVREAERELVVAGVVVAVPEDEDVLRGVRFQDLRPGRYVDVSGLPAGEGRVVATRVSLPAPSGFRTRIGPRIQDLVARARHLDRILLEGYVVARPRPGEIDVGGLRIDAAPAGEAVRDVRPGTRVRAAGRVLPDGRVRLEAPPSRPAPPRPEPPPTPHDRPQQRPATDLDHAQPPDKPDRPERPEMPERPDIERHERIDVRDTLR
jgi:hypothetical protein